MSKLKDSQEELSLLLKQEKELTDKVAKGDSFEELEKIIFELNEKYRIKGEYESVISQLNEVEEKMNGVTDFKEIDELSKQRDEIQNQIDEKNERYLYLLELQEQIENQ